MSIFCDKCGQYQFLRETCRCEPFAIYSDAWGEWINFHGLDEESAAEKAAEHYWDEGVEDGEETEFLIRGKDGGITKYTCVANYRIDYQAEMVESGLTDPLVDEKDGGE